MARRLLGGVGSLGREGVWVCVCVCEYIIGLKCKTLGGIHMQVSHSTAATHITLALCVYTAHARASASLPRVGLRLYLACFTPVAPAASL